jgi:hypothetical protein
MIPEAKRRGLVEALRAGPVRFKSGAVVGRDPDWFADLVVRYPDGRSRRVNEFAHDQIAQAYEAALVLPPPPAPPPQTFKPTRSRRDFGGCPF